jgi:NAD(P)-dependent dehydrogenase (short-subunit alcohol dehydrogenase family)
MSGLERIFSLQGRIAVVTGAAGGLGAAICEAMAEAGADVVCADVNLEGAEATAARVRDIGRDALPLRCDVSRANDVRKMVAHAVTHFGTLDILFNNAGISHRPAPVHQFSQSEWRRVIAIDLDGVFYCSREALKIMVQKKSGKIINIASIWGLAGSSGIKPLPAYSAAKGGVVNLTREMALEYAPLGINVNAICPGFFVTGLGRGAYGNPDFVSSLTAVTPAGRVARPDELKGAAIFLASGASDYLCGHMLVADGGVLAQ